MANRIDDIFAGTATIERPTTGQVDAIFAGVPGVTAELPTISLEQAQRKDRELLQTTGDLLTQLGLQEEPERRRLQLEAEREQVATAGRSAFEEAKAALKRGGFNVVAGLGGTLEELARLADKPVLNQLGEVGAEFALSARFDLQEPELTPSSFEGKTPAQKTGLFITQVVPETLAFMVGTTAATILGGPVAGGLFAFSVEGENAFQSAIDKGDTPDQANIDRLIVGTINAALEQMQVRNVLRFGEKGFKSLAKLARERTFAAVKTFGKEVSLAGLKQFITEGLQEATQELVSIGTPAIRRGEDVDIEAAAKQIGLAGLAGGVAGVALGGGSAGVQAISSALSQKIEAEPDVVTAREPEVVPPPTTVAEIFKPTAPVEAITPTTPTAPPVVDLQVTEGLEAKPEAVEGELTVEEIETEVQKSGLNSEDFELKPEKMKQLGLEKIALKVKGEVLSAKLGEDNIFNHFDLLRRSGAPEDIGTEDVTPGFLDTKGRFIEQFKAPVKKKVAVRQEVERLFQESKQARAKLETAEEELETLTGKERKAKESEIKKLSKEAEIARGKFSDFARRPTFVGIEPTPTAKPAEAAKPAKIPSKAPPVEPVKPTKIVSPGEAGPFKVTFKAEKGLPATRIIVDPKVRRSVQSAENKIAILKTKLNQAKADKKQAVIKATTEQIQKTEAQVAKLKERQEIKLINTTEKAKAVLNRLKTATKFKESLRRDAISMVRAIPKDLQPGFITRAGNAKTVANIKKLVGEIEKGVEAAEKKQAAASLEKTVKDIFRKKRVGRVKIGKLREKARVRVFEQLEGIDFKKLSSRKESELKAFEKDLKQLGFNLEQGIDSLTDVEIDAIKVLDPRVEQLRRLRQKSVSSLSVEEIRDIEDAIKYFVKQDELEDLMLQEGRAVESQKVIQQSSNEVMSSKAVKKKITDLTKKTGLGFTRGIRKAFIVESMHKGKLVQLATEANAKTMRNVLDNFIHKAKGVSLGKEFEALDAWEAGKDKIGWTKADTRSLQDIHEVTIAGHPRILFSTDQIMSIAKHLRSERNVGQLAKTVGLEIEGNKTGRMSLGEMVDAVDLLNDKQVALLDLTEEINVDILMPAVNETSLKIFGYELARNPQHWSLQRIGGKTVRGEVTKGPAIEDLGPFQPFVGGIRRLKISGFSEQWLWQIQTASFFHGSSIPIKNARTLLNNEDFQAAMIDGGREAELNSLITLFQRMQGVASDKAAFEQFGSLLLSRSVRSILGFRVSSALAQLGSIPMAFDIIPAKYGALLPGFKTQTGKAQSDRVNEFSPFLKMRMIGGRSTIETGDLGARAAADMLLWDKTPLLDKPLDPLRKQDRRAIMVLDGAVQRWVADTTDLKPGTEEFWNEVKSREEDVVRFTQPMWDLDERSVLSGSSNVFLRSVLSFRAAREAMLNQSAGSIDEALKTGKTKQLINTAAAVTTSVAMVRGMKIGLNSLLLAGATALLGFFGIERRRKKILSEQSAEKFAKDTAFDLLGNLPGGDIVSNLIRAKVLGERWREVRFDGVIGSLAQVIGQTFESFTIAYRAKIDGNDAKFKKNITEGLFDMVDSLARLTGLPASGILAVTKQPIFRALNQPTQAELENKAARLLQDKLTPRQIKRIKDELNAFGIVTKEDFTELLAGRKARPKKATIRKPGTPAFRRIQKETRAIKRFTE